MESPRAVKSKCHERHMNSDGRNDFIGGFRTGPSPSRPPDSSKEDVYTFIDTDQSFGPSDSNSNTKRFLSAARNDSNTATVENKSSPIRTPTKKIQVVKPLNGFNPSKDNQAGGLNNGVHKSDTERCPSKNTLFHESPRKSNDHNLIVNIDSNQFTKNSIISPIFKPESSKSKSTFQTKTLEPIIKKEVKSETLSSYSQSLFSNNSSPKSVTRKLPSGKPSSLTVQNGRGRGPALHEALQRITSSVESSNIEKSHKKHWHSPGSDILHCETINAYLSHDRNADSDSSDDIYPCGTWSISPNNVEDRSKRVRRLRENLRRQITQIEKSAAMISFSKSSNSLYQAIKSQLNYHIEDKPSSSFRIKGSPLNKLFSGSNAKNLLCASDRRKMRKKQGSAEKCSLSECNESRMESSCFCSIHTSINDEPKLFSLMNIKDETNSHIMTNNVCNRSSKQNLSSRSLRKRSKPSAVIKPQARSHKKISNNIYHNEIKDCYGSFNNDSQCYHTADIDNGVGSSSFLNQDETSAYESSEDMGIDGLSEVELMGSVNHNQNMVDPDVVAEVLALHESGELPLELPQSETPQENNLDLSAVFSDFFTEHNGGYIPTREETEELERALQAVQNVKSLDKVSTSQHSSLLDSLLDEKDLAETLASLPDVFSSIPPVKSSTDNGHGLSSLTS